MRFKLVETGKSYAEAGKSILTSEGKVSADDGKASVPPIIWETGNVSQIRSLLVLREAELLLTKAQLTGDSYRDWYIRNRILNLEIKITGLKSWLKEAVIKDKSNRD